VSRVATCEKRKPAEEVEWLEAIPFYEKRARRWTTDIPATVDGHRSCGSRRGSPSWKGKNDRTSRGILQGVWFCVSMYGRQTAIISHSQESPILGRTKKNSRLPMNRERICIVVWVIRGDLVWKKITLAKVNASEEEQTGAGKHQRAFVGGLHFVFSGEVQFWPLVELCVFRTFTGWKLRVSFSSG
jgi:hypothetical protein